MTIAPMQKIQIYCHQSKTAEILRVIQDLEILELTDIDEDFFTPVCKDELCGQDFGDMVEFWRQLFPEPKGFIENFIATKSIFKSPEFGELINKRQEVNQKLKVAQEDRESWLNLQKQRNSFQTELEKLELYAHFNISPEKLSKVKKLKYKLGMFTKINYQKWQELKRNIFIDYYEEIVEQDEKNVYLIFFIFPKDEIAFLEKLALAHFEEVLIPPA